MGNQEWTIQRKLNGQSRMNNSEKTEWAIKNGQFRDTGNVEHKAQGENKHKKLKRGAAQTSPKTEVEPRCSWRVNSYKTIGVK